MEKDNYYIYCISYKKPDINRDIRGHNNQLVFKVEYKELCAYVSKTAFTYIEAGLENLQCHEAVISCLMKNQDVLPMCFSTICKSKENVVEMLNQYYDQIIKNMEKCAGKVEMGIKVFYKLDFEEEDKKDKELLKDPKQYMMKRYDRYLNRQKKMNEILFVIEEYHKTLADMSADSCYTKPLKNNLIFNASYLVPLSEKAGFDQAVEEMKKNNPAYKIMYSGPWPAYHFINLVREGE